MAERDLAERGRGRVARDGLHPVSNPARLTGGVCAVRNGLHPMPYLMRLSRYSLLTQFILTQTASAQLPRHRRLAGAPHLSLGGSVVSNLFRNLVVAYGCLAGPLSPCSLIGPACPALLPPASHLLFPNSLSLPVGPVVIGSTVGKNWGFGAAPRRSSKESKCLLIEALGIVRMGAGELL